jgi:hypothetical protein
MKKVLLILALSCTLVYAINQISTTYTATSGQPITAAGTQGNTDTLRNGVNRVIDTMQGKFVRWSAFRTGDSTFSKMNIDTIPSADTINVAALRVAKIDSVYTPKGVRAALGIFTTRVTGDTIGARSMRANVFRCDSGNVRFDTMKARHAKIDTLYPLNRSEVWLKKSLYSDSASFNSSYGSVVSKIGLFNVGLIDTTRTIVARPDYLQGLSGDTIRVKSNIICELADSVKFVSMNGGFYGDSSSSRVLRASETFVGGNFTTVFGDFTATSGTVTTKYGSIDTLSAKKCTTNVQVAKRVTADTVQAGVLRVGTNYLTWNSDTTFPCSLFVKAVADTLKATGTAKARRTVIGTDTLIQMSFLTELVSGTSSTTDSIRLSWPPALRPDTTVYAGTVITENTSSIKNSMLRIFKDAATRVRLRDSDGGEVLDAGVTKIMRQTITFRKNGNQ